LEQSIRQFQSTEHVLARIRDEQENFSAAQAQVASYVLENYFSVPFLSITALASNIGVSESTVIKFCNQLGYKKFADFKRDLANGARDELVMSNRLSESSIMESGNRIAQMEMEDDFAAIEATLMDPKNFEAVEQLIPMIDEADRLYIAGGRSSGILAELFVNMLRYLGVKVYYLDLASSSALDGLNIVTPNDLVIVICLPRYTRNIIRSMEIMNKHGIPIALITDPGLSPARQYAQVIFQCKVTSSSYFPNTTGCVALMNAIARQISVARKDRASLHMSHLEQELLEDDVFYK